MKLPKSFITVTPFSRAVELILFIALPMIAFAFGIHYQKIISSYQKQGCTQETKICSDGSSVGRTEPNCEFAQCPITTPSPTQIIQISPTSGTTHYVCPQNGWVDCMPILTREKQRACSPEAMNWYKKNCPNFKGGAL